MIALKTFRNDLGAHLATGLSAAHAKLGAQVNPPSVIVGFGTPYVSVLDYWTDHIMFSVWVIAPPGDPPAVADALDNLIDKVRLTLRSASPGGNKYALQGEVTQTVYVSGDNELPAVVVNVHIERNVDAVDP